jgi:hypothetical protein
MKAENILEAEQEAKRFLKRIQEVKKLQPEPFKKDCKRPWFDTSKETGALKRSSMDLTRSLSKLRNNFV